MCVMKGLCKESYLKQSGPASKPNSASSFQSLGMKSTMGSWLSFSVSISNTVLSSPFSCEKENLIGIFYTLLNKRLVDLPHIRL